MKLLRFAGIALFALHSSVASALIIDNGDYTTDTELGLDYLDVGLIFDSSQIIVLASFTMEEHGNSQQQSSLQAPGLMRQV